MKRHRVVVLAIAFALCCFVVTPSSAQSTTRVSVSSEAAEASGSSGTYGLALSGNGRWVAFDSHADDLVEDDFNGVTDVFLHDRESGETIRVSVGPGGAEGNSISATPALSSDGRFVAFMSDASTIVPGDANGAIDVFVWDRETGTSTRVSVDEDGHESNGSSGRFPPAIAGDGSLVAFDSAASNLVPDDTNGVDDVFVRSLADGVTTRASVSASGEQANGRSIRPAMSADGQWLSFESLASNLVDDDTNGTWDVFVVELRTGVIQRASVGSAGEQASSDVGGSALSADGRFVAFTSRSSVFEPERPTDILSVYIRDRATGETTRVSDSAAGVPGNGESARPALSADGRFVVFDTRATNVLPGDANASRDIVLRDLLTGTIERVSVGAAGNVGDAGSFVPAISGDGRLIAFRSSSDNLVSDDRNQRADVFVRDREPCGRGSVNAALGDPVTVLRIDGHADSATAAIRQSVTVTLDASPSGPEAADYVLWVWPALPTRQTSLSLSGYALGCTVNPTPLAALLGPQPLRCLHSADSPAGACTGVRPYASPPSAPWTIVREGGFTQPMDLTLQGVLQDNGSATADSALSVTNAVVLRVR